MAKKNAIDEREGLLEEVQDHFDSSDTYLETIREGWDDLEAMLVAKLTDSLSPTTNNTVFDPILSSIVYERAARVMAQNPKGKAYAQSKDDVGKNILMNLLLKYYYKNASEQETMLVKLRLWDLYSLVYGTMFALVPWRVNDKGYVGPELNILPIRDCFPQPSKNNVSDMDWFIVRNLVSMAWLKTRDPDVWDMDEIEKLETDLKDAKSGGDEADNSEDDRLSFVQKTMYPNAEGDVLFPGVEILTEYRRDKWITWTPKRINDANSKPYILRIADDAYVGDMLPIVAKHAFPLIDSPIGFGEFARGKSLQMAINSLWNLYMQGVKYTIFPPLHINPENVVPSSIKWGPGEYWFMDNPNADVQPMNINPSGLNTFHSTFGALKSAIESQAGTTSTRESANTQSSLGKTPQAIKFIAEKEGARDEWDRVMLEQSITQVYERWVALTVSKMGKEVTLRLFKDEIEDIAATHPDVVELYDSGGRGEVKAKKKDINATYDFVLEAGSTVKPDLEAEQNNITSILKAVLENPPIMEALQAEGKMINLGELFKRWIVSGGTKDYDKIIVEMPKQEEEQIAPEEQIEEPPRQGIRPEDFQDPDIQQAVAQLMGGVPAQGGR